MQGLGVQDVSGLQVFGLRFPPDPAVAAATMDSPQFGSTGNCSSKGTKSSWYAVGTGAAGGVVATVADGRGGGSGGYAGVGLR